MAGNVKPIPQGYHTLTPHLVVKDAERAIDFYKRAFGAIESYRMKSPDGKHIIHAELKIGDSPLMIGEEMEGMKNKSAESLHGSPVSFYIYVSDSDHAFKRALGEGAKETMAMEDTFWGDRCGAVADPFGFQWTLATHKEDLSSEEIGKRAKEFFAKMKAA